ncbi:MAG: MerR family transcriptional regulator [Gemmatimonadota bacterium]
MDERRFRVGALARRTGLSVRTLHPYDELGLVPPTERTASGHRLYGPDAIARLQQVLSLRQLGLSLDEVKETLARPEFEPAGVIREQLARLRERLREVSGLVERLERLASHYEAADTVSVEEFIETIEGMAMIEKRYTPEQLEQLKRRREEVGEEKIREVEERWKGLVARVNEAIERGVDAESDSARELAREWRDLTRETIAGFTGGDAGLKESVSRLWRERPDIGARWGMGPEVQAWVRSAMAGLAPEA